MIGNALIFFEVWEEVQFVNCVAYIVVVMVHWFSSQMISWICASYYANGSMGGSNRQQNWDSKKSNTTFSQFTQVTRNRCYTDL